MWFGLLTLATALVISVSAAYYSILGLTAIFASAFWPIVILSGSLEVGKIVSTLWLHKYWARAELQYKLYLCTAVVILMLLTSMGVFVFLSKAHSDQSLVSGDVTAKVSIYDEKIRQARDNIGVARSALTQMDAAVDQTMGRSTDERGADKAAQLRRNQATERNRLLKEIEGEQRKIQALNDQRAPIAAEVRKVEAEVGPIKYIAALIYGDNLEANVLDKAVRWVIILIVIVFDPLALTLLLAATKTLEWERGIKAPVARRPDYEQDDGPLTNDQIDQIRTSARTDLPTGQIISKQSLFEDPKAEEFFARARTTAEAMDDGTYEAPDPEPIKKSSILAGLDGMWTRAKRLVIKDTEAEHAPLDLPAVTTTTSDAVLEKQAKREWKAQNPTDTIHRHEDLLAAGAIAQLPWNRPKFREQIALPDQSIMLDLGIQADNGPHTLNGTMRGFGTVFPGDPVKGDMFLRVDQLPSVLYKHNGNIWIQVDKDLSDQYTYDTAYIDHLIQKLISGEYDIDLLSNAERDSIEQRLKDTGQA